MSVLLPETVSQALEMMASDPNATPMNGGTDLLVHWPQQHELRDRRFVDLSGLMDLRPIRWTDDELHIGGLTTYWDVIREPSVQEEFPLLVEAGRQVGAIQIQSRGTWAGNIANASPAADGVPVLMAYDAIVEKESVRGPSEVPLQEFYLGYKEMRLEPDELITGIRLPRREFDVQVFEKVGSRSAQAITKVGVAVAHSTAGWRVVANSVAPVVCRCGSIERMLEDEAPVSSPDDLMTAIRSDISPIDDLRSTAEYRERVLARLLYYDLLGGCPWFT